jgi:hypothetical protein
MKPVLKYANLKIMKIAKGTTIKKRVTAVKKDEIAIYKAYYSDGECSGPFIAKLSENDTIALESANNKLNQHIAYNGLQNRNYLSLK